MKPEERGWVCHKQGEHISGRWADVQRQKMWEILVYSRKRTEVIQLQEERRVEGRPGGGLGPRHAVPTGGDFSLWKTVSRNGARFNPQKDPGSPWNSGVTESMGLKINNPHSFERCLTGCIVWVKGLGNGIVPSKQVGVLTPSTYKYGLIWK